MASEIYRCRPRRCWSVREGGRVVAHVNAACLRDVSFHVSESARQRMLRLGQRAVLAWARGTLTEAQRWPSAERIQFDPYAGPSFLMGDVVIVRASLIFLDADGSCWGIL